MTSDVDRKPYIEWLINEIDINARYHNHKENMAWIVTAFYVSGIGVLGYYITRISVHWGIVLILTLFIAVATCCIYLFVNVQFRKRWQASDIVIGLRSALSRLCSGLEIELSEYKVVEVRGGKWPLFVKKEIKWLPKKRRSFSKLWSDDRGKTEIASYALIVIAPVVIIALLWVSVFFSC